MSAQRLDLASRTFATFALLMLAGCGDPSTTAEQDGPQLPPLTLRPLVPEYERLAAQHTAPDSATQKVLTDYADIALNRVQADGRTAALSQRALLEHEAAWWPLERALVDDDVGVRRRAAWLCGESGQTILQLPLLLRLKYELDPETVLWVADALARLGNDGALGWLDAAIDNNDTATQAGSMAVTALRARDVELPEQPTWEQVRSALRAVASHWQKTGDTLLPDVAAPDPKQLESRLAKHLLTPNDTPLRPVDEARFIVRHLGRLAVPMLARTAHAEEHYMRTMPLQELGRLGPAAREATAAVLPLLGDPLSASYAVRTLGETGATEALPFLRPMLTDVDTELRVEAAQSLGLLRDETSRGPLEQRMNDEGETMDVRVSAAFGLLCLGDHPAADAFLRAREQAKDYHEPTLQRLRERLAAR